MPQPLRSTANLVAYPPGNRPPTPGNRPPTPVHNPKPTVDLLDQPHTTSGVSRGELEFDVRQLEGKQRWSQAEMFSASLLYLLGWKFTHLAQGSESGQKILSILAKALR